MYLNIILSVILIYQVYGAPDLNVYANFKNSTNNKCPSLTNSSLLEPQPEFLKDCGFANAELYRINSVTSKNQQEVLCLFYFSMLQHLCETVGQDKYVFDFHKAIESSATNPVDVCTSFKNNSDPSEVPEFLLKALRSDKICSRLCSEFDESVKIICVATNVLWTASDSLNSKHKKPKFVSHAQRNSNIAPLKEVNLQDSGHHNVITTKFQLPHSEKPLTTGEQLSIMEVVPQSAASNSNNPPKPQINHPLNNSQNVPTESQHKVKVQEPLPDVHPPPLQPKNAINSELAPKVKVETSASSDNKAKSTIDKITPNPSNVGLEFEISTNKIKPVESNTGNNLVGQGKSDGNIINPKASQAGTNTSIKKKVTEENAKAKDNINDNKPVELPEDVNYTDEEDDKFEPPVVKGAKTKPNEAATDFKDYNIYENEQSPKSSEVKVKPVEVSKPREIDEDSSNVAANFQNQNIDDSNSYFFSYFMMVCVMFICGYVAYHNKQKILALVLEGRKGRRPSRSRRPNSANYRKLDSTLEEAVTSSCNKNTTPVIY